MFSRIQHRLTLICLFNVIASTTVFYFFSITLITALLCLVIALASALFGFKGLSQRFLALETGLLNIKDNEFNTALPSKGNDEIAKLERLFNQACDKLRQEKQAIYQRELLLDTVIQNSPLAMLLVSNDQQVIYSNHAARLLLLNGKNLDGLNFKRLLLTQPESLQQVIESGRDGLFNLQEKSTAPNNNPVNNSESKNKAEQETQTWLLSRGQFALNGMYHQLYLFKQLTRELNRQEVAVWKKVIRVISHELNNSLAPISSMTHSGKLLIKPLNDDKLSLIFNTIEERVKHLSKFINGYGRLAKLPLPQRELINWSQIIMTIQQEVSFHWDGKIPPIACYCDLSQLQQLLVNLLKNAHESGSTVEDISLRLLNVNHGIQLDVLDRGTGMNDDVLKNALLPFYSTKNTGSGIGLPLCREIVEAHEGFINLVNRQGGGLKVSLWLPAQLK